MADSIQEENPLTLKYLFVAMHDINLVHILGGLDYYSDENDRVKWSTV